MTMRGARAAQSTRAGTLVGAVLAALAMAVLAAAPASAHANLIGSNPTDGASLADAPAQLVLHMSESVQLADTAVVITRGRGGQIASGPVKLLRTPGTGTEEPTTVVVTLPALAPDTYRVSWSTLSSDDLHPTHGVLVFGVRQAVSPANSTVADPPPNAIESVLRAAGFLALAAALGALVLLGLLSRVTMVTAEVVRKTRVRLRVLAVVGACGAFAADVALLLVQADGPRGALRLLGSGGYSARWSAHEAAVIALVVGGLAGLRAERARRQPRLLWARRSGVVLVVATLAVTAALLGHPASYGPLWIVVDAVHQSAALVWTGGVLAAAVAIALRAGPQRRRIVRAVLRGFTPVAAGCVLVLALTGLLLAGRGLASVDALLFSGYGRVLLVKTGLAVFVGLAGLANSVLLHRRLAGRRRSPARLLRMTVGAEAVLAALLLGAAAVLGSASPANGPEWAAPPVASSPTSLEVDDLVGSLGISPGNPGVANFVTVQVFDTRRPAPTVFRTVTVRLRTAEGTVVAGTAEPAGDGTYVLRTDQLVPGPWQVSVEIDRPGMAPAVTALEWVVRDPAARVPVVSGGPLAPVMGGMAAVLAALAAVTALIVRMSRRRRRDGLASARGPLGSTVALEAAGREVTDALPVEQAEPVGGRR